MTPSALRRGADQSTLAGYRRQPDASITEEEDDDVEEINVTLNDTIATVRMDRPPANAMSPAFLNKFAETFQRITDDDGIRGALLLGEGRMFSAGLDLKSALQLGPAGIGDFLDALDRGFGALYRCPKPVAAAVKGHAIAGGLVMALAADFLALAPSGYQVGLTELKVGIPFPRVAFEMVTGALPPRAVRRLIYGADLVDPQTAYALGVGDAMVDEPEAEARQWLTTVAARPKLQFQIAKRQLRGASWGRIENALAAERKAVLAAIAHPETLKAMMAVFS